MNSGISLRSHLNETVNLYTVFAIFVALTEFSDYYLQKSGLDNLIVFKVIPFLFLTLALIALIQIARALLLLERSLEGILYIFCFFLVALLLTVLYFLDNYPKTGKIMAVWFAFMHIYFLAYRIIEMSQNKLLWDKYNIKRSVNMLPLILLLMTLPGLFIAIYRFAYWVLDSAYALLNNNIKVFI